jgi:DNA polymerase
MVPKLWYGLEEAASRTVWDGTPHEFNGIEYRLEDGWLTCRSPAGAKIWYRNPTKERRVMPWDHDDIRPGFSFQTQKNGQWISKFAFGGQLAENIVMRIEVDIKNAGIHNLERAGYPVVLDVHDELVCELHKPDKKVFTECMLDLPNWIKSYRIPVAIDEPWIANRYRK